MKGHANYSKFSLIGLMLAGLLLTGCAENKDTVVLHGEEVALPAADDYALTFHCANEGITDEKCVLDNPNNPFARAPFLENCIVKDDQGVESNVCTNRTPPLRDKWGLASEMPGPKARYYLWATTLARYTWGENQFYTAEQLKELNKAKPDEVVQAQAIKAYRAVLDNYYDDNTELFYGGSLHTTPLRNLSGENLYGGGLFANSQEALDAMESWGYIYDPATKEVVRK